MVIKETIVVTKSKPIKPGSHRSVRPASYKASHAVMKSASYETSHTVMRSASYETSHTVPGYGLHRDR